MHAKYWQKYARVFNENSKAEFLTSLVNQNIHGKVFFCGEATTKDGSGTIAGALDTAKRVVKEVLDYFPPAKL